MTHIVVVDFGTGNLRSVSKALEHVARGAVVEVSRDPALIRDADRIVLPGQGAINAWMQALDDTDFATAIHTVLGDRPVLGICLGLEALYAHSTEDGGVDCLDILGGNVRHFREVHDLDDVTLKVPHMGWNRVYQRQCHPLWHGIEDGEYFYFVHSYFVDAAAPDEVAGETDYGVRFASAAMRKNIFATQFHPEKSATAGLTLLSNFVSWIPG